MDKEREAAVRDVNEARDRILSLPIKNLTVEQLFWILDFAKEGYHRPTLKEEVRLAENLKSVKNFLEGNANRSLVPSLDRVN